jgi:hypothetical protein
MAEVRLLDTTDSSSVCMRSVAASLRGEFMEPQDMPAWVGRLARLFGGLGRRFNTWAVDRSQSMAGIAPEVADRITTDDLARHALSFYQGLDGPFEAVIVGAPNGAVAHLATALGAPFLSQHLLTSFRDHKHADDIRTYAVRGCDLAGRILGRNPDVAVVNHYDPLHDRFLVRWMNHIRYKLLDLPEAYRQAIKRWLRPGGTLVFIDCRYPWRQYRVAERHTFQVGGLGGVSDHEFLTGSPQIEGMQHAERSAWPGGWRLDLPLEVQPESEWGTLPELRYACETFSRECGYEFLALTADHPDNFSTLAFHVWQALLSKVGTKPLATLIDCFTQVNPAAVRLSSLLPLWLPFNCTDSLTYLNRMLPELNSELPVLFAPVPNFAPAFDSAPIGAWLQALSGFDVRLLGIDPRHYPEDLAGLFRFTPALKAWCDRNPAPVDARLSPRELRQIAGAMAA